MKKTLWTFDFSVITIGTIISAIGGIAMNFALSIVVFDQTNSTFLTAVFSAVSFIPSLLLPIFVAPYVDAHNRKHMIVRIDTVNGVLYVAFALYLFLNEFNYLAYVLFSLVVCSTNAVYSLAYSSLYPDLIPKGFAQKGYSVSSMIYPSVTALITPVASILYVRFGVYSICLIEGILLLIAAMFEHMIRYQDHHLHVQEKFSLATYLSDMKEGFQYLKEEKGIQSIYMYMGVTNASAEGINLVAMALFQTSSVLNVTMYALLTTAETLGRIVGSIVHYFIKIPAHNRYNIALSIYTLYEVFDVLFLFLAYPLMIINRFICGFMGVNSMNIREASTQNYIPSRLRARVNGLFTVIVACFAILSKMIAGTLGEFLPYPYVSTIFAMFALICVGLIIVRNKKAVGAIYNQEI
ncbi:MAG: MFS transporter [Longicatena sp.]